MQLSPEDIDKLKEFSKNIRIETVRMIAQAGFGHIGGSASIADVLAVLYGLVMRIDPKRPDWEDRDWLVLSKGHSAPALYAALALRGYFPLEWLLTLNQPGTRLPSHTDARLVPGVDMSTGSLGQGVSSALGIAIGNRIQNKDVWTYCIAGDGECNEGEVWEACQTASHNKVDHYILFIDWNKKQLDGWLDQVSGPPGFEAKFLAFGFDVQTVRGYDVAEIFYAIQHAKQITGKPHVIILDTIKGLGVNFAEAAAFNHYMAFGPREAELAVAEIEKRYAEGSYPGGDYKW